MNAVQKELAARIESEREAQAYKPVKSGLTANQWTLIVIGIFTIMAVVLNQLGLIV